MQVLDARDPLGCRCPRVEQAVLESGGRKKLVLVLNKIDLVPREVVEQWLVYLRKEFPTIAFKASTQVGIETLQMGCDVCGVVVAHLACCRPAHLMLTHSRQVQKDHLAHSADSLSAEGGGTRGANMLLSLLANYCRNANIKTGIRVGIVGFPNVGKSSLINSLKRSRACAVAPTPGFTRSMQEVVLDKHVKLLDSPGAPMLSCPVRAYWQRSICGQVIEPTHVPACALPTAAALLKADARRYRVCKECHGRGPGAAQRGQAGQPP
jgi:nuclear GTP-binding protein